MISSTPENPTTTTGTPVSPEPLVCALPPQWDNGIIECADSRSDGSYDLGTVCQYLCGNGMCLTKLVFFTKHQSKY